MKQPRCPFRNSCPFASACKDHSWFCVWGFWAVLLAGFAAVTLMVWRAAQG
jgi:hypothetical protein